MSFLVASRGSGRVSSRAGFSGSGGAGSMAMSISGSRSASSVREGCWVVVVGSGAEVGFEVAWGEAMVDVSWEMFEYSRWRRTRAMQLWNVKAVWKGE